MGCEDEAHQSTGEQSRLLRCWGKVDKDSTQYHPAVFHMLDVGHTARVLLSAPASPRLRNVLGQVLGCDSESLSAWLPYFVALHDVGKLSSVFQGLRGEQRKRMEEVGFAFGPQADLHHSVISQTFIMDVLGAGDAGPVPAAFWDVVATCAGGHHGRFTTPDTLKEARSFVKYHEPIEWRELRLAGADALKTHFLSSDPGKWPEPRNISAAIMAFTGFTILCDWLGSDSSYFHAESEVEIGAYLRMSLRRSRQAVRKSGLLMPSASSAPVSFEHLFADKRPARPLQQAIDDIPESVLAGPCFAIIEAPTGEGKTEAALALAHRLAASSGTDELYYALPTTATSNQMFGRLQTHLRDRLALDAQVKLVHGQAFLVEDDLRLRPLGDGAGDQSDPSLEWFGPKKRALLAPFGVGTIDQVELAVLNVKHTALRLIGLSGKVVIFDEVHAYDTYMTTLIEALLKWLRELGTSVILLSATLPRLRREALSRAYGAGADDSAQAQVYPCVSVFGVNAVHHASPKAQQAARRLSLNFLRLADDEAGVDAKARWLLGNVADGGCACWMTNTVRRAQEVFRKVDQIARDEGIELDRMLIHAQFPLEEREQRERILAEKYGPKGARPRHGIVIGTQVLEQSLDVDFDVMVSDLAPIDMLLQRAGRLQRHERERPRQHHEQRFYVNVPHSQVGEIELSVDRYIYASFLLGQTWEVLRGMSEIELPKDYRRLVEAVYGFTALPPGHPLQAEWDALQQWEAQAVSEARLRLLPDPDPEWAFSSRINRLRFEESDTRAAWIVARTRLGEESITVIPMMRRGDTAWAWPSGTEMPLRYPAQRDAQLALLRRQLRISNWAVIKALRVEEPPRLFSQSPLLKECLPLWLEEGQLRLPLKVGSLLLTMEHDLGLTIRKEGA